MQAGLQVGCFNAWAAPDFGVLKPCPRHQEAIGPRGPSASCQRPTAEACRERETVSGAPGCTAGRSRWVGMSLLDAATASWLAD